MWYVIGVPLLLMIMIALITDLKRKRFRRSLEHELKGSKDVGEAQFYRDMNKSIDYHKNN